MPNQEPKLLMWWVQISSSAIAAASEYWPEKFGKLDDAANHQVRHNLRQVRPVLVNGVEALVMVQ